MGRSADEHRARQARDERVHNTALHQAMRRKGMSNDEIRQSFRDGLMQAGMSEDEIAAALADWPFDDTPTVG